MQDLHIVCAHHTVPIMCVSACKRETANLCQNDFHVHVSWCQLLNQIYFFTVKGHFLNSEL